MLVVLGQELLPEERNCILKVWHGALLVRPKLCNVVASGIYLGGFCRSLGAASSFYYAILI